MGAMEDLHNPDLFVENPPGEYTYTQTELGKTASGQLKLSSDPQRDPKAQREAGGEDRRVEDGFWGKDDGGHLIAARFDGATDDRNLTPQNRNLNRQSYKNIESSWAEHLEAGDKVYVHMESYTGGDSQRPSAYMGYAIIEHTDEQGKTTREIEYYSMNNESAATMETIEGETVAFEAEHPEYIEERAENTTMEYIWDEEKQDLVANPYYVPEQQGASEYAPQPVETTQEAVNEYSPTANTATQTATTGMENSAGSGQAYEA